MSCGPSTALLSFPASLGQSFIKSGASEFQEPSDLHLPSAGIAGGCPHAQLYYFYLRVSPGDLKSGPSTLLTALCPRAPRSIISNVPSSQLA